MRIPCTDFVLLLLLLIIGLPNACTAADGRIKVRIVEDNRPTPARAWVDVKGQRLFNPVEPKAATPYPRDRSFSCDGVFTIVAPEGDAIVHIEKGKEFLPVDARVEIKAGETTESTIEIKRWVDMPATGWYSADLHVHFGNDNPRVLRQLALADDVHLIPSFTYWLRGRGETWNSKWPDDEFKKPITIDDRHIITRNNIEIERIDRNAAPGATIGATFLFNLTQPVIARRYGEHFPTDAELCRVARRHSPTSVFDSDKPSWAETVIGAALGQLDTVQVCHNHYHRISSIPGGYGMIGPLESGESNAAVGDGLFHRTNALYYRLLNCGFRLGVSGGSAIGVMPLPAGFNRTYARIKGEFTARKLWASIKAGRTFATTGPILTLTANGEDIGATVSVKSSGTQAIKIRTTVRAIEKLEALQVIHNGSVIASQKLLKKPATPIVDDELTAEVIPKESGWVVSRALYRAPDGLLRQAHTSPIYISVNNKPTASAVDARYMLRWIDQLVEVANLPDRYPTKDAKQGVLETYAEARAKYEQIIEAAQQP